MGLSQIDSTLARVYLAWHGPNANSTWALAHSVRLGPGFTRLDFGLGDSTWLLPGPTRLEFDLDWLGSTLAQTESTQFWPELNRLDMDSNWFCSTWVRIESAQSRLGPSQNPTQNFFWIIQKCIQSISNSYPIKWIGFKI